MTVAVRYEYAEGTDALRDEHRPAHVAFLTELYDRGVIIASGRLDDDQRPGALLVLAVADPATAARLLDADPFHVAGAIAERDIRDWHVVFGATRLEP